MQTNFAHVACAALTPNPTSRNKFENKLSEYTRISIHNHKHTHTHTHTHTHIYAPSPSHAKEMRAACQESQSYKKTKATSYMCYAKYKPIVQIAKTIRAQHIKK